LASYCKILVVDDEIITRQGMKHLVDWEKEGFQVVGETPNGEEALELIESLKPDIVISDIIMPVMDGLSLTQIVHEKYPDIQIVILSGYSEFDYVKSTFQNGAADYILKPTLNPQNLLETLKKIAAKIPNMTLTSSRSMSIENMVNQVIFGFEHDSSCEKLSKIFVHPCFLLLGMNVPYVFGEFGDHMRRQRKLLEAEAAVFLTGYTYQLVSVNSQMLMLVINFAEQEYGRLIVNIKNMVEHMSPVNPNLFYVYSEIFRSVGQIKAIYNDRFAKFAEQQFYHRKDKILCVNEITLAIRSDNFNMKAYNGMIKNLQLKEALNYLEDFTEHAVADRSLGEIELKIVTQNAFYTFLSMLEDLHFNLDSLHHLKRNCFIQISEAKYAQDFLAALRGILADFYTLIDKYQINLDDTTIKKITAYISEHYADPLTLNDLARKFNFNYYYLSSYFSAHNKEGFSEYLNQVRIEKATELLRHAKVPIAQVSIAVGYSDHSYFCKVFKKSTGSTPSDFRKKFLPPFWRKDHATDHME
jgi:Response regulator containing CheY-like receiver domain and AraC-type DNA-binding domain